MRIVIAVMSVTFYILYEVLYGNWRFTNAVIAEVERLWHMTGF